jgi:hypothetical protein
MRSRSDQHLLTVRQGLSKIQLTRRGGTPQATGGVNRILHPSVMR